MMISCCDNEDEQTASTFGDIFDKAQDWIIQVITGTPNAGEESTQNVIVSILFLVHITIVFCFLAHHCSTRVNRDNY